MFLRDNSAQNARLLPGRSPAIGPDTLGRFTRILRAGISALPESAVRIGGVGDTPHRLNGIPRLGISRRKKLCPSADAFF